jgi:hypothetical protein
MLFRKLSIVRQGLNTFPLRLYFIRQELSIVGCALFPIRNIPIFNSLRVY